MNSIVWDCLIIACFFSRCRMFSPKPNWAITELSYHGGACHSSNVRERCSVARLMCAPTTLPSGDEVVLTEITRHNSKNWMWVMQESFRTAISMARWFHRALRIISTIQNFQVPVMLFFSVLGIHSIKISCIHETMVSSFFSFFQLHSFVFSIALIFFRLHAMEIMWRYFWL